MDKAFTTARLTFQAFDDTNEAQKTFFHKSIQSDPLNFSQSDNSLFRPQSAKTSNDLFKKIADMLLAVIIYRAPDPVPTEEKPEAKDEKDSKEEKLEPIGILVLSTMLLASHSHHSSCSLGVSLAAPFQGKGYGTEAINWGLDWAFKHGNLHSVGLACFGFNVGAARLYERLGFVKEGVLRERLWSNGGWHDEILFGMVRGDWEKLREKGGE